MQYPLSFQSWGRQRLVTRNIDGVFRVAPSPAMLAQDPIKAQLALHAGNIPEQPALSSKALEMAGGPILCSRSISAYGRAVGGGRKAGWWHPALLRPPPRPPAPDQGPRSLSRSCHLQENSLPSDRGAEDGWSGLLPAPAHANALMVCKWLPIDEVSS